MQLNSSAAMFMKIGDISLALELQALRQHRLQPEADPVVWSIRTVLLQQRLAVNSGVGDRHDLSGSTSVNVCRTACTLVWHGCWEDNVRKHPFPSGPPYRPHNKHGHLRIWLLL